jgi:hypothetical protein
MSKRLKVFIVVLITAGIFSLGYAAISKQMAFNSKEGVTPSGTTSRQESIGQWTFNIPNEFKEDKKYDGPWYEKKYINNKSASVLVGYYEPNGIDNRNDTQIFNETVNKYDQDLKRVYGEGNIIKKDIDSEKKYSAIYYQTSKQKIVIRSIMKDRVWKTITIQLPKSGNEEDYKDILENIK